MFPVEILEYESESAQEKSHPQMDDKYASKYQSESEKIYKGSEVTSAVSSALAANYQTERSDVSKVFDCKENYLLYF